MKSIKFLHYKYHARVISYRVIVDFNLNYKSGSCNLFLLLISYSGTNSIVS